MTFREWINDQPTDYRNRNYVDDLELVYLAGQASASQRVYELLALVEDWKKQHAELERERDEYLAAKLVEEPLRRQIALLERERDQWKYTAEIRQQHLEYTIKAQAGEPIYGMAQQRQLNPSPQVRSDVGSLGNTYPATEPVKAQAGEQYGQVTPTYDELVKQVSELNRLYKFDNRTMEDLVSKLDAFKVVCEKAARSIEYLLERATDSDDSAYGTLSTNFVRDCLRVNLIELNDVLGLENYVE